MSFAVIDKNAIMDDERVQRLKKIKLLERENAEMAPFWAEKQKALFPTAIQLTQTPSIGQIITEEAQRNAGNPDVLYQRAEQKIKQIADNVNTEYILDRLNDLDLKYLVNGWDGIVKQIKEKYSASGGLDKDIFVAIVKENASNMDKNLSGIETKEMTDRGYLRKEQKDAENAKIQKEMDEKFMKDKAYRRKLTNISTKRDKALQREKEESLQKAERDNMFAEDEYPYIQLDKKHQKYKQRRALRDAEIEAMSAEDVNRIPSEKKDKAALILQKFGLEIMKKSYLKKLQNQNDELIDDGVEESKLGNTSSDINEAKYIIRKFGRKALKKSALKKIEESDIPPPEESKNGNKISDINEAKYIIRKFGRKALKKSALKKIEESDIPPPPPPPEEPQNGNTSSNINEAKYIIRKFGRKALKKSALKKIEESDIPPPPETPSPLKKISKKNIEEMITRLKSKNTDDDKTIGPSPSEISRPKQKLSSTKIEEMLTIAKQKSRLNRNSKEELRALYLLTFEKEPDLKLKKEDLIEKILDKKMNVVNSIPTPKNMPLKKDDLSTLTRTELRKKYEDLNKTWLQLQNTIERETDSVALKDHIQYEKRVRQEIADVAKESAQRLNVGKGLVKKMIIGSGYSESPVDVRKRKNAVMKKVINGKYIDLNKLKDNILMIRYCSTNALIPTIKVQRITDDTKGVINDIIGDKFEKRLFEKLSEDEKRIVKRFVQVFNLDLDVSDKMDEEYRKQFEIVLGQFNAGNTNPAIKTKLKQYITESMESGFLPRRQCFKLLFELANA